MHVLLQPCREGWVTDFWLCLLSSTRIVRRCGCSICRLYYTRTRSSKGQLIHPALWDPPTAYARGVLATLV